MKKTYRHPAVRFLMIAALSYGAWLLLYYFLIKPYTNWDYYLNYSLVLISDQLFNWFGITTLIELESDHVILSVYGSDQRGVWIGDECNGFKLFSIFAIFILAFPGQLKSKLWFIPLGIVLIHTANLIRVMCLLIIAEKYPAFLDFNHLYTFTIFVYSIIFLLWLWWVKKYGHVKKD
jgi:exosortase family protein XrtF